MLSSTAQHKQYAILEPHDFLSFHLFLSYTCVLFGAQQLLRQINILFQLLSL